MSLPHLAVPLTLEDFVPPARTALIELTARHAQAKGYYTGIAEGNE